jgi:hypothetical protein
MECLIDGRRTGKTTWLIKRSLATGEPIVTVNAEMANFIKHQASNMGLKVPQVMSVHDFLMQDRHRFEKVLFDEMGMFVEGEIGAVVDAATVCGTAVGNKELGKARLGCGSE